MENVVNAVETKKEEKKENIFVVGENVLLTDWMAEAFNKNPNKEPRIFLGLMNEDGKVDHDKVVSLSLFNQQGQPTVVPLTNEEKKDLGIQSETKTISINITFPNPAVLIERVKDKVGNFVNRSTELGEEGLQKIAEQQEALYLKKENVKESAKNTFKEKKENLFNYFQDKVDSLRTRMTNYMTEKMEPFVRTKDTLKEMFNAAKSVWDKRQEEQRVKEEEKARSEKKGKQNGNEAPSIDKEAEKKLEVTFNKTCEELASNLIVRSSGRVETLATLNGKHCYFQLGEKAENVYENLTEVANALTALKHPEIYPGLKQDNVKPILPMKGVVLEEKLAPNVVEFSVKNLKGLADKTQDRIRKVLETEKFKDMDMSSPSSLAQLIKAASLEAKKERAIENAKTREAMEKDTKKITAKKQTQESSLGMA